jgi:hypothetical protein
MNITHVRMATEHLDMWEQLIGTRKNPLKQAAIIGFGTLFALFTRRLTLDDAVARVCDRIGIKGRAIVWPYAEPCMDIDKPSQLELLRADLARQQESKPSGRTKSTTKKTTKTTRAKSAAKPAQSRKKTTSTKKPANTKTSKAKLNVEE